MAPAKRCYQAESVAIATDFLGYDYDQDHFGGLLSFALWVMAIHMSHFRGGTLKVDDRVAGPALARSNYRIKHGHKLGKMGDDGHAYYNPELWGWFGTQN